MHPCILLSIKNNKRVSHGTPKNRCILLLLEKVQALDYDIIGPITLLHQFLFRFCFVCVSGLQTVIQILMVLAQIGSLVSWSDHLMTYIHRLMDHRGRILYSPEWETAEAAVLVFFVLDARQLYPMEWRAAIWHLGNEFSCFCVYSWPVAKCRSEFMSTLVFSGVQESLCLLLHESINKLDHKASWHKGSCLFSVYR